MSSILYSPLRELRIRDDSAGDGRFGAIRKRTTGTRTFSYAHKGVDLIGRKGDSVFAPCDCMITRVGRAYSDPDASHLELIVVEWELGMMKLMYLTPLVRAGLYCQGCKLGELQSVSQYHGDRSMQDHLHWEVMVRSKEQGVLSCVNPLMFFHPDEVQS